MLRDAACEFARAAGAFLLEGYGRVHAPEKKGRIDLVTEYDRRSEALAAVAHPQAIPGARDPGGGIGRACRRASWDPRGRRTGASAPPHQAGGRGHPPPRNSLALRPARRHHELRPHNYPFFLCEHRRRGGGAMAAGAVYDPVRDELFAAAAGAGATLDGEPIRTSAIPLLEDALLVTGSRTTFANTPSGTCRCSRSS